MAKIMIPKIKKFANIKFIANTKTGYKKFNLSKFPGYLYLQIMQHIMIL